MKYITIDETIINLEQVELIRPIGPYENTQRPYGIEFEFARGNVHTCWYSSKEASYRQLAEVLSILNWREGCIH